MRCKIKYCECIVKFFLYSLLIGLFLRFYFIDQLNEYLQYNTSLFSQFRDITDKDYPNLIICPRPKFKVVPKYNAKGLFDPSTLVYQIAVARR